MKAMFEKKDWAVVGANINPGKYGNKIFNKLQKHNYNVIPVNPNYNEVEGVKCYDSLKDMLLLPDCVNVVVPPKRSINVVEDCIELGIKYIWFQPGTFDEAVLDMAEKGGLNVVYYNCVLVELDNL